MRITHQERYTGLATAMLLWVGMAYAQAPVEDGHHTPDAVLDTQQKAGMAYHEWQQATAAGAQAEQAYQQAVQTYEAAQQQFKATKQQAMAAQQKFESAKIKEERRRKAYEQATRAVERSWDDGVRRK